MYLVFVGVVPDGGGRAGGGGDDLRGFAVISDVQPVEADFFVFPGAVKGGQRAVVFFGGDLGLQAVVGEFGPGDDEQGVKEVGLGIFLGR